MAVRIRLKKMGRTHRPFYRICAFDQNTPRDGRPIEELGTYDTSVPETDARAIFDRERVDYWLSVGAQPSEKCAVLIKKYGSQGTHLEQQQQALDRLAAPKTVPSPGAPASLPKKAAEPQPEQPAAEASAAEETAEAPPAAEAPAAAEESSKSEE
ncbi:MAG: 30S ribosomal protein S16 [Planctomycetales bacterium]|nr:30S ribosomal protein S16 [Planctomycetales bacterium]